MAWELVTPTELAAYKERSGLSWVAIAAQLGVTHGAVYCWRVGRTTAPIETQRRMAELFCGAEPEPAGSLPDVVAAAFFEGAFAPLHCDAARLFAGLVTAVQDEGRA